MKITIQGLDYSCALDASHPLTIERKLNQPSVCQFWLALPHKSSLARPVRNQSVVIAGDDRTQYFTGYVATTPLLEYVGQSCDGPSYRVVIHAISDELLLDQLPLVSSKGATGMTAGQLMTSLVGHVRSNSLAVGAMPADLPIGDFVVEPGASWSESAGQIACQARARYRALGGVLELAQIPVVIHPLNEEDGSVNPANLSFACGGNRTPANDVTVCGVHEPVALVTEYFLGDGVTAQFNLSAEPFFPPASKTRMIEERFAQSGIDLSVWNLAGASGYLTLGSGGLAMNGGNGVDGETQLSWIDSIEMGGTLLLEAAGVALATGSSGMLAGFFVGLQTVSGCIAGFQAQVQAGTGAVSLQPIVQGAGAGPTFPVNPAHQYTLRIRVHCPECIRSLALYRSYGDSGEIVCGGEQNAAPASLHFEIQEYVNGVAGMPVMLYDGSIAALPSACSVVAASSINLVGSMRALTLTNLGSGWVVSTPRGGASHTRRIGTIADMADCYIDRSGKLVFYTGSVPQVGERIAVSYRTVGRAVGRAVNAQSQQELTAAGLPPVANWTGSVLSPPARTSADCRNAANTLAQASASVSALWRGIYKATCQSLANDVWPGDALELNAPSMNICTQLVVRAVKLSYASSYPDLVNFDIAFANDWAEDLAIKTGNSVPSDAWLPASIGLTFLPDLTGMTVTALDGTAVTINCGVAPPSGGGFEIRRRDFGFMAGEDLDLVLRGSQQTMTFARESVNDRFYIRMYDGSTPPNYSEHSTAVFINLPLDSDGD
jgi:hypothetical protein